MNKTMRSILAFVFAFAMLGILGLCSCTPDSPSGSSSSASTSTSAASASAASSSASTSSSGTTTSTSSGAATSTSSASSSSSSASSSSAQGLTVDENGEYTSKDEVALYIHLYGHLPGNYISKTKARKAGWKSTTGNLWAVLPGKSIGGSTFNDDDNQLPKAKGRHWTECDIDYQGGYRNSKRIVFSNDGLIFYTDDHYKTFEQLY